MAADKKAIEAVQSGADRNAWWWIPTLYFGQGIPYVVVMTLSVIMYKNLGLSNTDIALYTSWLYLPWVIKPLWSPLVDMFKTKRYWIVTLQLIIGASLALVALTLPTAHFFQLTLAVFWLMAFSSATHDIAADGYYMLALPQHEQAAFVGVRSTFYRIAMIAGQGGLVYLAGMISEQTGNVAFAWSIVLGVGCGVLAAVYANRWWDRVVQVLALGGLSMPSFWLAMLLILLFSVQLEWLPSSGDGSAAHLVMPALTLGWYFAAAHMRLTRSSMLEVLGNDYVKLARIKGLPERLVILRHALKNALIPVLTLAAINLVSMVNAAVVVETVFAWPGIGRLLYEGIAFRDFPVIQTTVLLAGVMIICVNLAVDLLYAWIDPRIRHA